eukprot:TRINITY_DN9838_c0_g1_i1.p1 TRINITY_DN9838_c0_g1~~TRINITY_DN9838_c0_g1_i1.p1  ORF type:complete len:279 (-),score=22.15 TRINITY_DN9838_c0_g1_i1:161-997(-)
MDDVLPAFGSEHWRPRRARGYSCESSASMDICNGVPEVTDLGLSGWPPNMREARVSTGSAPAYLGERNPEVTPTDTQEHPTPASTPQSTPRDVDDVCRICGVAVSNNPANVGMQRRYTCRSCGCAVCGQCGLRHAAYGRLCQACCVERPDWEKARAFLADVNMSLSRFWPEGSEGSRPSPVSTGSAWRPDAAYATGGDASAISSQARRFYLRVHAEVADLERQWEAHTSTNTSPRGSQRPDESDVSVTAGTRVHSSAELQPAGHLDRCVACRKSCSIQ